MENFGQYDVPEENICVALNVGQPSNFMLNDIKKKYLNRAIEDFIALENPSVLQYGKISGYNSFINNLSVFLTRQYKNKINSENLFITDGITGALKLILPLLGTESETIFVEDPTYMNALSIFDEYYMNVIPIKINKNGIDLEQLEKELEKKDKNKSCYLYIIPFFQNPTGYSMSEENKIKLGELCDKFPNLVILSDEVYYMLNYNEETIKLNSLSNYHKNIISLGTFSKILFPAIRLGWIIADEKYIKILTKSGIMDSAGGLTLSCNLIHSLLKDNIFEIIDYWKIFLMNNKKYLCDNLKKYLSEYIENMSDIEEQKGGYFIWVKFTNDIDTSELANKQESFKIKFHHGNKFSYSKSCKNYIRLSFSWYHEENNYEFFAIRMRILIQDYIQHNKLVNLLTGKSEKLLLSKKLDENNLKKIKVFILGHTGKLGLEIIQKIKLCHDLLFVSGIGRDYNISNIFPNIGCEYILNKSVIVDVSQPEGTLGLINKLLKTKTYVPLVIGTTGNLPMEQITEYSKFAPVLISSNFSRGFGELVKMIKIIDKSCLETNMIEKHHIHKKDKPSGTAKTLAGIYGLNLDKINSVREGEIIGEHELILDSEYETIKIIHSAKSRKLFALGALDWIRKSVGFTNGIINYDNLN